MDKSYSLLVIEDDPNHQKLIQRALGKDRSPFSIIKTVPDTAEAKRFVKQMDFDCFLVDNHLPKQSGIEFITSLQKQGVQGPFVLMTSAGTEELVIQAYRNKVSDYLTKDVGFWQDLPAIMRQVMETAEIDRAHESRVHELERVNEGLDEVNTEVQVQFDELRKCRSATRELLACAVEDIAALVKKTKDKDAKRELKAIQATLVKAAASSRQPND